MKRHKQPRVVELTGTAVAEAFARKRHSYRLFVAESPRGPGFELLEEAWRLEDSNGPRRRIAKLYEKAADFGQTDAMINLGNRLLFGDGLKLSRSEAIRWFRRAWTSSHDGVAAYNLGVVFDPALPQNSTGNRRVAIRWYRLAVGKGVAAALPKLSWLLWNGRGSRDRAESVRLLVEGERLGALNPGDLYNLALSFEFGPGAKVDLARAMRLYRRSAALGNADAQVALGYNLKNGIGARANTKAAIPFYDAAAKQGDLSAHFNLGSIYLEPEYADLRRARAHLRFAARRGHRRSEALLARVRKARHS